MLIKYLWTSSVTINEEPNKASITILPWQIVDVSEDRAQSLKDIYWPSVWEDVDSDNTNGLVLSRTINLTNAQIKALNTTPQVLVPAPWAWKAIVVQEVISALDYATAAFDTNTDLEIRYDWTEAWDGAGAEATMDSLDAILLLTADAIYRTPWLWASADTALTINKGITAIVASGNPATWGWTLRLTVFYRIVSL